MKAEEGSIYDIEAQKRAIADKYSMEEIGMKKRRKKTNLTPKKKKRK
jgi:hypothetical protein